MTQIREATPDDQNSVIAVWTECELVKPQNNPITDFDLALTTSSSTVLVLEKYGETIGAVMVGFDGHRGWFYYLGVKPEHQNKGFGRQLIEAAEDWLKERGAPKSMLMLRHSNTKVLEFYKKLGYSVEETFVLGKRF